MIDGEPSTYKEIMALVNASDGVATVYAASLRRAEAAGRLTLGINERISASLHNRGLGHVPFNVYDLPTQQDDLVRVYDKTSPLGRVIEAAHTVGEDADVRLREALDDTTATDLLDQVRTLLA